MLYELKLRYFEALAMRNIASANFAPEKLSIKLETVQRDIGSIFRK